MHTALANLGNAVNSGDFAKATGALTNITPGDLQKMMTASAASADPPCCPSPNARASPGQDDLAGNVLANKRRKQKSFDTAGEALKIQSKSMDAVREVKSVAQDAAGTAKATLDMAEGDKAEYPGLFNLAKSRLLLVQAWAKDDPSEFGSFVEAMALPEA
eukprot:15476651-Alexandrium_andersonii.AAC.1